MLVTLGVVLWIILAIFALRGARWAYAIFVILAFVFIPARGGFHFHPPQCNLWPSWDLMLASATKYKHVFLFGIFFLMTRVQLGRKRHASLIAAAATIAIGILIELEETTTRTGTCGVRDLLPDAEGAIVGALVWRVWKG